MDQGAARYPLEGWLGESRQDWLTEQAPGQCDAYPD